ncbi:MAG: hypothetical protein QM765_35955 [Myxococcales bacterium]
MNAYRWLPIVSGLWLFAGCSNPPPVTDGCKVNAQCARDEVCEDGACLYKDCPAACAGGEACVGGRCLPASCGDRPCRAGEGCAGGRCQAADCLDVSCPQGEACARGACYPVDCGSDGSCESGVCWAARCVSAACVDVPCEAGQVCVQGACLPESCAGVVCGAGAACRDGRCEEIACAGVVCSEAGTACSDGRCVPEACSSGPCDPGRVCVDERCVDAACVGVTCSAGTRCRRGACAPCTSWEAECGDRTDEDCDGQTDCADPDCEQVDGCLCPEGTAEGDGCGDGKVCAGGSCKSGCFIDGSYRTSGARDPANACQVCSPATSTTAWSHKTEGSGCATGKICHAKTCQAGCLIEGAFVEDGTVAPGDPCQQCGPETNTSAWSVAPDGTHCGAGLTCNAGTCAAGCYIDGSYYANGALDPANPCRSCASAVAADAWTARADGSDCGTGRVCDGGACVSGCWISGALQASGAPNPANPCQACAPATSTMAWTDVAGGTSCGSGKVCNGATCSTGCWIGGSFRASGAEDPSNACQTCAPSTSTTAWTVRAGGSSCGAGKVCNGATCSGGCWIGGSYRASGADNPSSACQQCEPSTSTTLWTNKAQGTGCGGNSYCCSGSCVAKNSTAHCGACGVDCSRTLGQCRQQASGGYSCYCNTNASCRLITGADATCWISTSNPPGPNNCQCQCPNNVSGCLGQCPNGGRCAEAGGNGNYCYY